MSDKEKKGILYSVGDAVSKAGDAIKDFSESEKAEKVSAGVKKGAKTIAGGVAKGAKAAANGVSTGAQRAAENIKESAEKNAQKKAEKKELRKEIKAELEAEKVAEQERIKADRTDESNHTIIEMKKSGMRFLIPDGYTNLKPNKKDKIGDPRADKAKEQFVYGNSADYSRGCFIVFDTSAEEAMDFDGKQDVIDGIHETMNDKQGLICVESGKTNRGYDYIYSIVKTIDDEQTLGVNYYVRMNLGYKGKILELQASFVEVNFTGLRESTASIMACDIGLIKPGDLEGWCEDPYDPSFTKGIRMNLAERAGLDAFFSDNPLSQARELVHAIISDELMEEVKAGPIFKQREDDSNKSSEELEKEKAEREEANKLLLSAFDKGEKCRRHTYLVTVK